MTVFTLANIATDEGDRAAIVVADRCYRADRLPATLPQGGLIELVRDWDASLAALQTLAGSLDRRGAAPGAWVQRPNVVAPIRFPDKLVCVGANYSDHLAQFGLPAEKWVPMPFFLRPPRTSIVGPGRTVRIPLMTRQFDWEIELAVVIGRTLKAATVTQARAAIAGYSIGIDF